MLKFTKRTFHGAVGCTATLRLPRDHWEWVVIITENYRNLSKIAENLPMLLMDH